MKPSAPYTIFAIPLALYPLLNSSTAHAQSAPLVDVCTGLSVQLPVLQPIISGLGAIVDGILNLNLTQALSGQELGLTVLDTADQPVNLADDCNLTTDAVVVETNTGISMGGGKLSGLGGTNNVEAVAGDVNSIAIGNGAETTLAAANSIALGLRGSVTAVDGIALGRDATASVAGGIALGSDSLANRAGLNGATEAYSGAAVASTNGALSVGTVGGERQIINVAGGTQDTDAVNLRQLRAVNDAMGAGLDDVAAALGGGATFNSTTNVLTGPNYTLRGTTYTDVGSALNALNGAIGGAGTNGAVAANNTSGLPDAAASGADATALGYGASASHANSTAVGTGATTTRDNQIALGTSSNTYTMAGVTSAASRAAQVGPTQVLTTDAAGNIASVDVDLGRMRSDIGSNRREARQGIATAMAMTSAPTPSAPGKTSWSSNVAAFKGEMATSFAMAHMFDTAYPVVLNASLGYAPGGDAGVRVGLSGEF